MNRIILHCDLDCFFASVEIRDNPEYKGKPVIIGVDPMEGRGRGVVSTCSYEARIFGLHSGMPISRAYKNCPLGIYLRPHSKKYFNASKEVMNILNQYSPIFEQVGIDEAYLDISHVCENYEKVKLLCKKMQLEVLEEVGITVSIGCSSTKSIAKIASDVRKPNAITIVRPEEITEFLQDMDITRIPGIGKKSKIYYNKKGIKTIGDIINTPLYKMIELFGKNGKWVHDIVNGKDAREVKEFHGDRKSISKERTFYQDTDDFNEILLKFEEINEKLHKSVVKNNIFYKTISLKVRFEGFVTYTRAKSVPFPIQDKDKVLEVILELYKEFSNFNKKVRLVGIKLANFEKNPKVKQTSILNFAMI